MGYRVDGVLPVGVPTATDTLPPWASEFDMRTLYVSLPENAGPVSEAAFYHRPSKSLVATDAVVFIPTEAPPIFKTYFDAATVDTPDFWPKSVLQAVFLPLRRGDPSAAADVVYRTGVRRPPIRVHGWPDVGGGGSDAIGSDAVVLAALAWPAWYEFCAPEDALPPHVAAVGGLVRGCDPEPTMVLIKPRIIFLCRTASRSVKPISSFVTGEQCCCPSHSSIAERS